ncbi:MAG: LysM domain-containing protein [Desulfitobacteriaceae bacterium]|nr:LysM domain-containing protein [Desulfitobacteriaceae bacterium]MDD4345779.1 LysM domain-containing protein [Desulfitobacteriaceae bacterium]MDD4401482.1 LysM domain-containing protein [Desulfitobacteriaceae bacterium]
MCHCVRKGESLYKIAKRNGITVHRLLQKNPHLKRRPNLIYPGECVKVR